MPWYPHLSLSTGLRALHSVRTVPEPGSGVLVLRRDYEDRLFYSPMLAAAGLRFRLVSTVLDIIQPGSFKELSGQSAIIVSSGGDIPRFSGPMDPWTGFPSVSSLRSMDMFRSPRGLAGTPWLSEERLLDHPELLALHCHGIELLPLGIPLPAVRSEDSCRRLAVPASVLSLLRSESVVGFRVRMVKAVQRWLSCTDETEFFPTARGLDTWCLFQPSEYSHAHGVASLQAHGFKNSSGSVSQRLVLWDHAILPTNLCIISRAK